jgi:hemoglobin
MPVHGDFGIPQMSQAKGKSRLGDNFFDEIGGYPCLKRVHELLYDKLCAHPWLSGFFVKSKLEIVKSQQTDFWAGLMGGPSRFVGRTPRDAHVHMFLPAEVFAIRHALLGEAIREAGVPDECHGRYRNEEIILVPRPNNF